MMVQSVARDEASSQNSQAASGDGLAVSWYDRVSSALVAALGLAGVVVLGLLVVYFSSRLFRSPTPVPVDLVELSLGSGEGGLSEAPEIEPPGAEDVPEVLEPRLTSTLSAVADAISDQQAILAQEATEAEALASGPGSRDSRRAGPEGGQGAGEGRATRWEIRFDGGTLVQYAQQLDYFNIELAVLGSDDLVHYAYDVSQPQPAKRTGPPSAEDRLYMAWRTGSLKEADRELLQRAGILSEGRDILQFYPPEVEAQLAQVEQQHAGPRDIETIRKTVFGVRRAGGGYEFYVIEQQHR
ncbi:MAG: hypothetical protein WDZ59_12940 [Pirellulales bacterium]